jgi:hypothetical protein
VAAGKAGQPIPMSAFKQQLTQAYPSLDAAFLASLDKFEIGCFVFFLLFFIIICFIL